MYLQSRKPGFVLAMVLVLLALTTLAMASTVRLSLRVASEASLRRQDVQSRWGTLSCQNALLPLAESVLQMQEANLGRSSAVARRSLVLGNVEFGLIFGDEQAKANVNVLFQKRGKETAERIVREVLSGSPLAPRLHLRPMQPITGSSSLLAPIGSFGQVLEFSDPDELLESASGYPVLTEVVTCWGDGRINYLRADETVMRSVLAPGLSPLQIQRLMTLRRESPKLPLPEVLQRLELRGSQSAAMEASLSPESACHSLWIAPHASRRTEYRLVIHQGTPRNGVAEVFQW